MTQKLNFSDNHQEGLAEGEAGLLIDIDGFEGPLDLLLELARRQKVDLHRISLLELTEQYLLYIDEARRLRLELAADYLVMAAWLAYLKSRLLLPDPPKDDEPSIEELASLFALRLQRLETIREAAQLLAERNRLGRDVFARGAPEAIKDARQSQWDVSLYELLSAYASQREKHFNARVTLRKRRVWSLEEAKIALEHLIGSAADWVNLDAYLAQYLSEPALRPTVIASTLSATLEMVKDGHFAIHQEQPFGKVWLKRHEKR